MKKKLIIAFLILCVLGLASIPALYPLAKHIRSQQHLDSAIAAKEAGEDRDAFFKLQSAYNLAPENEAILSRLGAYSAAVLHPQTLERWTEAADRGLLNDDEWIEMVRFGLESGQTDTVTPYLYRLSRQSPEDTEIQLLRLRVLTEKRRDREAFLLARSLVHDEGVTEEAALRTYLGGTFTLAGISPQEQRDAIVRLLDIATSNPSAQPSFAAQALPGFWSQLQPEEKVRLEQLYEAFPPENLLERLRIFSLKLDDGAEATAIRADADAAFQAARKTRTDQTEAEEESTNPLTLYVEWLNQEGFHEEVIAILKREDAKASPELYNALQTALISSGQAESAYNNSLEENPLSEARNLLLRAFAQARMGEVDSLRQTLSLAAEAVDIDEVGWMESILRNAGELDLLVQMYEQLERTLPQPVPAQLRLIPYYYALLDQDDLQRLVRDLDITSLTGIRTNEVPLYYFHLLFRDNLKASREVIEAKVHELPMVADYRILLGFSYALSGRPEAALDIIEASWSPQSAVQPRIQSIMIAFVYLLNGRTDEARNLIQEIPKDRLLPMERVLLSSVLS